MKNILQIWRIFRSLLVLSTRVRQCADTPGHTSCVRCTGGLQISDPSSANAAMYPSGPSLSPAKRGINPNVFLSVVTRSAAVHRDRVERFLNHPAAVDVQRHRNHVAFHLAHQEPLLVARPVLEKLLNDAVSVDAHDHRPHLREQLLKDHLQLRSFEQPTDGRAGSVPVGSAGRPVAAIGTGGAGSAAAAAQCDGVGETDEVGQQQQQQQQQQQLLIIAHLHLDVPGMMGSKTSRYGSIHNDTRDGSLHNQPSYQQQKLVFAALGHSSCKCTLQSSLSATGWRGCCWQGLGVPAV